MVWRRNGVVGRGACGGGLVGESGGLVMCFLTDAK